MRLFTLVAGGTAVLFPLPHACGIASSVLKKVHFMLTEFRYLLPS